MTWYFDDTHARIRDANRDTIDAIEETLIRDCSIASEFPGFPVALRDRIDDIALRSTCARPVNAEPHEGFDTFEEHQRYVSAICFDLHTIFHEVSQSNSRGFSDDPRSPLRVLCARAEERREFLTAKRTALAGTEGR